MWSWLQYTGSVFDSPKTKSRRLLNQPTEPKELKLDSTWLKDWFSARRSKLSALVIGAALAWLLKSLVQNYYPAELRDWLIPGSYAVPLLLFWLVQVYLYSFVFLNSGRAIVLSLGVCWLVWLKLHRFELDLSTISVTVLCVGFALLVTRQKTNQL